MTKDYGEILLEAMSTLLTAATQPKAEDQEKEKTVEKINTADPLTNFLPNHSQTFTGGNVLWSNIGHNASDNLLAINCVITTKKLKSVSGSFGLTIALYGKDADKPYGIVFDSSQMIGNIYNFISMPQRLILSIPNDMEVLAVSVKSYNNTNDSIKFDVDSITLSFGQDLNIIGPTLEPFIITCADSQPRYTVTDRGTVVENPNSYYRLEARYVGKRANGNYYTLTPSNKIYLDTTNTSVRWYRYFPKGARADKVDNWGGAGWEYLENLDGFELTCKPPEFFSAEHEVEKFKAVFVSMNLETGQPIVHTSNIIEIAKEVVPTEGFINGMRLVLEDGTSGSYPFYESDGYIRPTLMAESAIERVAKCEYDTTYFDEGKTHSEDFFDYLDTIEWVYSPWSITSATLKSSLTQQEFIDNNGYAHIIVDCDTVANKATLDELCQFKYKIPAQRSSTALGTDKIECYIYFSDGKNYTASRGITLSQLGNSGTDYTIVTRLFSGSGRLAAAVPKGSNDLYYIECDVYDPEGKCLETTDYSLETSYPKVTISGNGQETITTETLTFSGTDNDKDSIPRKLWLPKQLSEPIVIDVKVRLQVETSIEETSEENSEEGTAAKTRTLVLQDTFIVPLCGSTYTSHVYRGASKVIYNSEGSKPVYDKSFLELLPNVANITWELSRSFKDASLNPEITKSGNNYTFTPVGMFDRKLENKNFLRIQAKSGKDIIWDQPIVFSQNKHFSAIIDGWDGSFQINEEGNYIMSSAYVAGGKDDNNKFTGLVMGELGTIAATESQGVKTYANSHEVAPNPTETGLFGYREGAQSFGFRTDGTAFIGESGGGRINFDGNSGVIYSGNFDGFRTVTDKDNNIVTDEKGNPLVQVTEGSQGTYLDLQNGTLIASNGTFRGELNTESGLLAGWKLDAQGLHRSRASQAAAAAIVNEEEQKVAQGYWCGINSETFNAIALESVPFEFSTPSSGNYYIRIDGAKSGSKATTWEIPRYINQIPVTEIMTPVLDQVQGESNSTVTTIKIDKKVNGMVIGPRAFENYTALQEVYIPKGVSKISHGAFSNTAKNLQIYLEGEVGLNWTAGWQGSATVYYNQTDKFVNMEIEDFKTYEKGNNPYGNKLVRFYAGGTQAAPSMAEWETAKNNNNKIFLVTDEGEAFMTNATIKNATVTIGDFEQVVTNKLVVRNSLTQSDTIRVIKSGAEDIYVVYGSDSINSSGGRFSINCPSMEIKTGTSMKIFGQTVQVVNNNYPGIVLSSSIDKINSGNVPQIKLQITAYSPEDTEQVASLELDYYKLQKLADLLAD